MVARLSPDVVESRRWLPPVLVLMGSAVLTSISPAFPPVHSADGSSAAATVGTGWLIGLSVFACLALLLRGTEIGLAAIAGAGVLSIGRLLGDVGLLVAPDGVLRPELFGVNSVSAFPLTPTWAVAVPLLADVAGSFAAVLAGRTVLDEYQPPPFDPGGARQPRPFRAGPAPLLGLFAGALVVGGSLGSGYAAPVPVVRPLGLADIGLFGTGAAALTGLVLALVILAASALPAESAHGLLIGAGTAAAAPFLVVVSAGGDTRPSTLAWLGLAGGVLLAASGGLVGHRREPGGDGLPPVPKPAESEPRSGGWIALVPSGFAIAAGGCALVAYAVPQATTVITAAGASFAAAGAGFLPAGVLLIVVGVLTAPAAVDLRVPMQSSAALPILGRLRTFGTAVRPVLGVSWVPVTAALLVSSEFTSSSIWLSSAVFTEGGVQRSGGSWWGAAAVVGASVAAIGGALLAGRARDSAPPALDPDEDPAGVRLRRRVAATLGVVTFATYSWPVYRSNGRDSSALFVGGGRVDSYAAWLSVVTLIAVVWAAGRRSRGEAVALLAAAAAVAGTRIALTPVVRAQVGFEWRPGAVLSAVLVIALLTAAAVVARWRAGQPISGGSSKTPVGRVAALDEGGSA